jgi:hypothetical protein
MDNQQAPEREKYGIPDVVWLSPLYSRVETEESKYFDHQFISADLAAKQAREKVDDFISKVKEHAAERYQLEVSEGFNRTFGHIVETLIREAQA